MVDEKCPICKKTDLIEMYLVSLEKLKNLQTDEIVAGYWEVTVSSCSNCGVMFLINK